MAVSLDHCITCIITPLSVPKYRSFWIFQVYSYDPLLSIQYHFFARYVLPASLSHCYSSTSKFSPLSPANGCLHPSRVEVASRANDTETTT
ncbi:hypothetical protein COCMIDRAFT_102245 [Bipolaris oryzae ATCC 44560]|uniref:Uncharacterized protein n=1 Tax=Bipolaris oryzae ATCC 44560 TaxID=930090 RepID=W6YZ99_COCMI|nr:uncharacterized protein COCMIDRAFT_102245 [Bipolaris oryzae ATCC 44560]EUC42918.1 hypothetical protein COCMIDRAFT_102245 [Bipolaris oryzae ATCC 44560]